MWICVCTIHQVFEVVRSVLGAVVAPSGNMVDGIVGSAEFTSTEAGREITTLLTT